MYLFNQTPLQKKKGKGKKMIRIDWHSKRILNIKHNTCYLQGGKNAEELNQRKKKEKKNDNALLFFFFCRLFSF